MKATHASRKPRAKKKALKNEETEEKAEE